MSGEINIRRGNDGDFAVLGKVAHLAIRESAFRYTPEQRRAWSPKARTAEEMQDRLSGQAIWVAETEQDLVGFITLADTGYIDFAYILKGWQGRGVFISLYEVLEFQARAGWTARLTTACQLATPGRRFGVSASK